MSTEQSESAHSQEETQTAHSQVEITQQATTPTTTTTTQRVKIPSVWLLANWLLKERGWPGNNRKKLQLRLLSLSQTTRRKPPPRPLSQPRLQKTKAQSVAEKKNSSLSTTQWLAVGSLIVSLVGLYYKREELKTVFSKKTPEPARVEPQPARTTQPKGVRHMD